MSQKKQNIYTNFRLPYALLKQIILDACTPKTAAPKKKPKKKIKTAKNREKIRNKLEKKNTITKPAVGSIDCIQHTRQGCVYHFWAASPLHTPQNLLNRICNVFFFFVFLSGDSFSKFCRLFPDNVANFRKFFFL